MRRLAALGLVCLGLVAHAVTAALRDAGSAELDEIELGPPAPAT